MAEYGAYQSQYGQALSQQNYAEAESNKYVVDLFNAAQQRGFGVTAKTDFTEVEDFLKGQADYDSILSSAGGLAEATRRGYTGTDVAGAYNYLDSFNSAANSARGTGYNVTPETTYDDLTTQFTGDQASAEAFNAATPTPEGEFKFADEPIARAPQQKRSGSQSSLAQGQEDAGAPQQTTADQLMQQAQGMLSGQMPQSGYTGPSIVDYLNSVGQNSSFASRAQLAQAQGIQNYTGTAAQNTQLLNTLRSSVPQQQQSSTTSNSTAQTGQPTLPQTATGKTPAQNIIDTWGEAAKQLGLNDIKSRYEDIVDDEKELQDELNDKIADINDNPWLTEGVRVKQIQSLEGRYETKLLTLSNQAKLYDSLYQEANEQARFLVGEINDSTEKAMEIAQKKEEAMAKLAEINPAEFKEVQGGLYNIRTGEWLVGPKADGAGGLSSAQINSTVNSIAGAFDNEQIVKEYNTIRAYVNTFDNLGTSPSDDQARIYAFAKVMDPNSVVRESEYKTVQDYAQALIKTAGINVARVFTDMGTLTPEARSAMSTTLSTRFGVQQNLYNQVSSEYQRQIDDAYAGQARQITNYSGGTPAGTQNTTQTLSAEDAFAEYQKEIQKRAPSPTSTVPKPQTSTTANSTQPYGSGLFGNNYKPLSFSLSSFIK